MMVAKFIFICFTLFLVVHEAVGLSDTACYGSQSCDFYQLTCPDDEIISLTNLIVGRKNESVCSTHLQHCDYEATCCSLFATDLDRESFNDKNTFDTYTNCSGRSACTHQSPWQVMTIGQTSTFVHLEYDCQTRSDKLTFCGSSDGPSTATGRYVEILFDGSRERYDPLKASKECQCTITNLLPSAQRVDVELKDVRMFSYTRSNGWWDCSSAKFQAPSLSELTCTNVTDILTSIERNFRYDSEYNFVVGSAEYMTLTDIHAQGELDFPASIWVSLQENVLKLTLFEDDNLKANDNATGDGLGIEYIEASSGDIEVSCQEVIPADFTTTTTTTTSTTTTTTPTTTTTTTTTTPKPTTTTSTTTSTTTTPKPTTTTTTPTTTTSTTTTTPKPTTTTTTPTTTTTTTPKPTITTTTTTSTTTTTPKPTTTTTPKPTTTTTTTPKPTTTTTTTTTPKPTTTTTTTPKPTTTTTTTTTPKPTTTTTTTPKPTTTTTTTTTPKPTTTTTTPKPTTTTTTPKPTTTTTTTPSPTTTTTTTPTTTTTTTPIPTTTTTTPKSTTTTTTQNPTTTTTTTPQPTTTTTTTPKPTTTTTTTPKPTTTTTTTPKPTTTTTTTPNPTTRSETTNSPFAQADGRRIGDGIDDDKQDTQVFMAIFVPIMILVVVMTAFFIWAFWRRNRSSVKLVRSAKSRKNPIYKFDNTLPISEIEPNSPVVLEFRDSPEFVTDEDARGFINYGYHIPSGNNSPRDGFHL